MEKLSQVVDIPTVGNLGREKVKFKKLNTAKTIVPNTAQAKNRYNLDPVRIQNALSNNDPVILRQLSEQFYRLSGEYRRLVHYMAQLLTYDHLVIPRFQVEEPAEVNKLNKNLKKVLDYTKNAAIEETSYMIAFSVVKDGIFFGYERELGNDQIAMLRLSPDYSRIRYKVNGVYQVEFDLKYFDQFRTEEDKIDEFAGYPPEFEKAYLAYKKDNDLRWLALDPNYARAHMLETPTPLFSTIFLDLLELDEYKNIDKTRIKLSLYTLLVQKVPLNKDNELALYMEEIEDLHRNARNMISSDIIDVLTTPCEIDAVTLDSGTQSRVEKDDIEKATNSIYTSAGTPIALFNAGTATGSIGLNLSAKTDETLMFPLLKQFERWYQNKFYELSPSYEFGIIFPPITIFNRSEKITEYINAGTYGFPTKLLALTAMGIRQYDTDFLLMYENILMDLPNRMMPLSSSHTSNNNAEGRPESEEPLSEEGEETRDGLKNDDRAGGE